VYEAGHTANGTRQVAMGLAGAIVVLPSDGTGYGTDATAYDDDAVMVLGEVDPRLNADPSGFDMRDFAPRYRLINGKPFPETDPVPTDQGHRVLVRYVNAGSQAHSMSVLGGNQVEVAQDGHRMTYSQTVTAETVVPGATLDALVAMPTGPEAKLAVYEAAGRLSNDGQHTADPTQLAFGGMMTFLDTAAPPPSDDLVGPVSTHVTVTPSTSDGTSPVTVTADVSDATTGGLPVTQAEFVVDDAVSTGPGFGTAMTSPSFSATPPADVTVAGATGTISTAALDALEAGKHLVYVRGLDAAGNWGVIGSVVLNLPKTGPQTTGGSVADVPTNGTQDVVLSATGDDRAAAGSITAAEYFVDTVGADGTGIAMSVNRNASVAALTATIGAATVRQLGEGKHVLYVHSKDSLGLWGPPLSVDLPVDLSGPVADAASVGPNPTNGVLSDRGNPGYLLVSAQISDPAGVDGLAGHLVDAEGFLDPSSSSPPGGSGFQLVAVDGTMDSQTEAVYGLLPVSQVKALPNGVHHVAVRGQDDAGTWGPLFTVELTVDKTAPVLGTLTASPNPTAGSPTVTLSVPVTETTMVAGAEYWLGTADPGAGKATSVPVSVSDGVATVVLPVSALPRGVQRVNLRLKDSAGNWSKPASTSVTVVPPNAIFADGFESGSTAAWSAATGTLAVTTAAGLPNDGVNRGLQFTVRTTGTNRSSYVTDTTPSAEPTYHARFALDPGTLTAGTTATAALTVFQTTTAAGGQVFAVQLRRSGTTAQVRTVLNRSGAGALTGGWVSLAAGARTLQVDWASATAGSVRLSVDGAAVQTLTGSTTTLKVDTARLGAVAGIITSTRGSGSVDAFVSTRNTMP
jgi:hypothetical protein